MRLRSFILSVFAVGVVLTVLVSRFFDVGFHREHWSILAGFGLVLAGVPALLAAIPPRFALTLGGLLAVLAGFSGWSVLRTPGDGGIGGIIVLIVTAVFFLFVVGIAALRHSLVRRETDVE